MSSQSQRISLFGRHPLPTIECYHYIQGCYECAMTGKVTLNALQQENSIGRGQKFMSALWSIINVTMPRIPFSDSFFCSIVTKTDDQLYSKNIKFEYRCKTI